MRDSGSSAEPGLAGTARLRLSADRGALVIAIICVLSLFLWAQPGLTLPDGAGYYVYLPSTWIDHDLLFFNEWQRLGLVRNGLPVFKSATDTGHLGNHWTVGPALLWYPAFVAGDAARAIIPSFRHYHRDGVVLPYNLAVITASALAGLGTLLAGYSIARRWLPARNAAIAAIAIWFGSPLLWYSVRDAAMSHSVSAFACALVVWLSLRLRDTRTTEAVLAAGLAVGFAALVRIQNAAFVLVPLLMLDREQRAFFIRRGHWFVTGGLLAVLPELLVSTILYGNPLGFASIGVRAIGWHPWEKFWPVETLFSWYHGLFTWTPIAALGIAGLVMLWRTDRRFAAAGLTMFAIQWVANSTADRAFWAALSFG
ncbi:MAG TPA: glycosyltransferase family 39 protein, partial [Thermoanaerobaculia bacterium]|nr:glycosyltransferase family 39 protein [Thermoanaerobaculia bacterium]